MKNELFAPGADEKKVEYIELVYDLIFVYLIGRSNSLLDRIEGGFITLGTFVNYLLSSLIVLQIWYYTTMFINRFGKNGLRDKLMMLVNMFLLYIMGSCTIHGWDLNYYAFAGAWVLILLNIALQYFLRMRDACAPCEKRLLRGAVIVLLVQAAAVCATIPVYAATGLTLGPWAVWIGFLAALFMPKVAVNFEHLTERAMLYVVFTFGEMIVIVAAYFSDGFTFDTIYYALVSFLVTAGLFFSYGLMYDRLLDRKREDDGVLYMVLHVFLIVSLSCVTAALEFMRDAEVDATPKSVMLILSLLAFFLALAFTEHWSVRQFRKKTRFLLLLGGEFAVFAAAAFLTRSNGYVSGALTVVFIFAQLLTLRLSDRLTEKRG